ncbi:hypothetical protein ACWD6I_08380, partial [Streptomyces sp. NPDC002454]
EEAAGSVTAAPDFDTLLGAALGSGTADGRAVPSRATGGVRPRVRRPPGTPRPWRTAWQLVLLQAVVMPGAWAPLSAFGFVGATLLASAYGREPAGVRLFGAAAVLLLVFGALTVASPRRDPRRELFFTLPVSPTAVFLARLTVVLCADVAMAMVCSVLVDGHGWWTVVSSWLGESLLAASLALALTVRHTGATGAAAGGAVWLTGVLIGPQGVFATPADGLVTALLATTPWTLLLATLLLVWALGAMRSFGTAEASPG